MEIKVRAITENKEVLNGCRVTVWKDALDKEPSKIFMDKIYKAEHSPIRDKWFVIEITGIKYWLSTHFVRHSIGYTPKVSTQRSDRLEYEGSRDERRQGELVNMNITLNAQAWINVSRKRICGQADIQAQQLWNAVVRKLKKIDESLYKNCVPECIYRGFCPEMQQCNQCRTELEYYKNWRREYIKGYPVIEHWK